ncbi:hypothetical protein D029_4558B, partial [Vibrio parahaemolyticus 970107]
LSAKPVVKRLALSISRVMSKMSSLALLVLAKEWRAIFSIFVKY